MWFHILAANRVANQVSILHYLFLEFLIIIVYLFKDTAVPKLIGNYGLN